jgi:hypothetical protein
MARFRQTGLFTCTWVALAIFHIDREIHGLLVGWEPCTGLSLLKISRQGEAPCTLPITQSLRIHALAAAHTPHK